MDYILDLGEDKPYCNLDVIRFIFFLSYLSYKYFITVV